ncbi:MAG: lipoyl(octanoyl) transferase LipB [Candidatus Omnitrophica bacterium]|nr:lipoyl(octanoyl) transferase LipB [Candidatus Omnitrophota bacterium]
MEIRVFNLGITDFENVWKLQRDLVVQAENAIIPFNLVVCQHYPVFTCGRKTDVNTILATEKKAREEGIRVYVIERGGDITYHGPGQVTVYPVFDLRFLKKDLHWFLRSLEEVALELLVEFGARGERKTGMTGAWFGACKFASIGIAVKNWITFHGMSINVKRDDLRNFQLIKPCGMDIEMTCLENILGLNLKIDEIKRIVVRKIGELISQGITRPGLLWQYEQRAPYYVSLSGSIRMTVGQ